MNKLLTKLETLLGDILAEANTMEATRDERLHYARRLDHIMSYKQVDIETALMESLAQEDADKILKGELDEHVLNEYPSGFYRSELRTLFRKASS